MSEPYYVTLDQARDALGTGETPLPEEVLSNAKLTELIESAEDLVDDQLGVREVDFETGRKVREDEIEDWQSRKLMKATRALVKFLYENPEWGTEQRFASVGGDVSGSSPYGSPFPVAAALLDDSGLRQLTTGTGGRHRESVIGNLPETD